MEEKKSEIADLEKLKAETIHVRNEIAAGRMVSPGMTSDGAVADLAQRIALYDRLLARLRGDNA